ncbi:hypothetical protein A9L43_14220 [Pseudomonas mosselii]|uniref:YhfG family protein n=1 Tax=Pseudomonas mosselii TaxID=78327 RepID=UPI00083D8748|nr:hypothetical protein A9L43_14220 [Pseudomonas mosselii]
MLLSIRYNRDVFTHQGVLKVKGISLETKKAYCAKTRRSNYVASLRLEGFTVSPDAAERELPSGEELLRKYRKQS